MIGEIDGDQTEMAEKKAQIIPTESLIYFHQVKKFNLYSMSDGNKYRGPCPPEIKEMLSENQSLSTYLRFHKH